MKKILFIILFFSTLSLSAQINLKQSKENALETINQINYEYKIGNLDNISKLFTQNIICLVCNEKTVGGDFIVENSKIQSIISEVIPFLKLNKLSKSKMIYNQDNDEFTLGYQLVKPNPRINFEGSGCVVYFKNDNGKLKVSGIMTIP